MDYELGPELSPILSEKLEELDNLEMEINSLQERLIEAYSPRDEPIEIGGMTFTPYKDRMGYWCGWEYSEGQDPDTLNIEINYSVLHTVKSYYCRWFGAVSLPLSTTFADLAEGLAGSPYDPAKQYDPHRSTRSVAFRDPITAAKALVRVAEAWRAYRK